jgi:serine/threonine protein phosphatase PrpC
MLIKDYICDVGLKRKVNEDSFIIDEKNYFIVVSDGMGGHEKGDIASKIVVDSFYKTLNAFLEVEEYSNLNEFEEKIINYLNISNKNASDLITNYANKFDIKKTIGATVAGIFIEEVFKKMVIFHLGDSRVYRIRDNKIEQLTKDHSAYSEEKTSNKNILLKAVGNFKIFNMEINILDYEVKDIYLICSDGVSNLVNNEEILDVISKYSNNYCDIIKEKIYNNGARDNFTLVISEIR